jgi:hypothetical protein
VKKATTMGKNVKSLGKNVQILPQTAEKPKNVLKY